MIYLNPEVKSGLGEDTFWTWMNREFPNSSFRVPPTLGEKDVVLQYSTLGRSQTQGGKRVGLMWELHPEMVHQKIAGEWPRQMANINACAAGSDYRVIASPVMNEFYKDVSVLPIGVDGDLFRPRDKAAMRVKYGIPTGKRVGFWSGTSHPMKAFDRVREYTTANPDVHMIIVWKKRIDHNLEGHTVRAFVPQAMLAELMACADFLLVCGRLRPFFMVEWEAMACDLPVVNISGLDKDFTPSEHPRADLERMGWLRKDAKVKWTEFLESIGAEV